MSRGWHGFTDLAFIADMAQVLGVAVLLGALLAYHPRVRAKATSLTQLEQPKTVVLYAVVGALVALLVQASPVMAMVIFGIGGLLRFRTDVGEAKDTGRVILVTVIGLCCGLKLFVPAVLATLFGWVLVWILERQTLDRLLVQGVEGRLLARAADQYRLSLTRRGCAVLGEKKNVLKGQVAFVLRRPAAVDRLAIERGVEEDLPEELRGTVDWEGN